ncbi:MAG: hypothetical protein EKK47_23310 [Burkholderiales bacterium]|nr:MAG: hypothetical protein EKK47_23310 [Burkholderiales bacterium]
MERLSSLLAHRRSIWFWAMAGVLLNALCIGTPPFTDDFLQWAILTHHLQPAPHAGTAFGLFDLVDGPPALVQSLKASGRLLWCTSDSLHLAFWRPLSEMTHWLDYRLWPHSPALMRVHSLLWYGGLILLVGRLYRLIDDGQRPARSSLATLIFAASSLHFFVIMWISARNQLIAACFMVMALMAYHLWRTGKGTRYGWLAGLALSLGLLSAEAAIATMAYLLAYAVVLDQRERWRDRLIALLPFVLIVLAWRLGHVALGFGSTGSGSYVEPGMSARFAYAVAHRLPTLMLAELVGIGAGITQTMTLAAESVYAAAAATVIVLLAGLMAYFRLWAKPQVRFYALGALLALVPVCAINPADRLLLNSEIGMSALLAALFHQVAVNRHRYKGWPAFGIKSVVALLVMIHLVVFPLTTLISPVVTDRTVSSSSISEPLSIPDEAARPNVHAILINPPAPFLLFYYPLVRSYFGKANPASMQALANGGNQDLQLTVLDEHTIKVASSKSFVQPISRDVLTQPFKVGDVTHMGEVLVTVTEVSDKGEPLGVTFRFPTPLSDPQWQFYVWREPGYARLQLPEPGQSIQMPSLDLRKVVAQRLKGKSIS